MKFIFSLLILASCSTTTLVTRQPKLPTASPPEIAPLNLSQYNWKILTEQDLKQLLKSGNHIALYSLDNNNYMIFDSDLHELQRYIQEQDQVITFYKQLEDDKNSESNQKPK